MQIHLPKLNHCCIAWNSDSSRRHWLLYEHKQNVCFNWEGTISTLNNGPLKLVENFMYLGSDVSIWLAKVWTVIHRLSIIWKSGLSDEIMGFLKSSGCVNTTLWMHQMDADKMHREKARQELYKNAVSYIKGILESKLNKTAAVQPLTSHLKNHPRQKRYVGHCWGSKDKFIKEVFLWTRTARTYLQQLCTDTGCSWEHWPGVMRGMVGGNKSGEIRASNITWR